MFTQQSQHSTHSHFESLKTLLTLMKNSVYIIDSCENLTNAQRHSKCRCIIMITKSFEMAFIYNDESDIYLQR